ncbi:serine/threonine protein kinase [Mycobacteroides abscessus subsp. abscessus]|uniref:serine/threonine-protein kinase n=1 Tax=Mycobacteroides abscessus TaxID=36809 RepID=UPI000925F7AA|nr:serine/threonine-protein kinase [Mycobacteroides abscessus]SHX67825.1 serine/threonine protein kinase [Mycobacteroides abscessus subsp. abscessus]SIC58680.1 serine/threonine protein kinase [Mycobacteroides abscessus subsp. abscessus]SKK19439.1 serine/threonine protein kinase [Mycobacteroides abscessus subsp. abscessus]SKP49495.1 serine/threonine protein kinase [Mycobacteroides abscessus subsp. abscessus]SKR42354.1 serine/threonine protein kinase [Mycobacteroides abscessus subsp. abscessus]
MQPPQPSREDAGSSAAAPATLLPVDFTEIAEYRVIRQLGAGGMGQVFLVQHPRLPRQDALKLLDAGVSRNGDFKVRFQREADLLAQLSHPNIVTLHDRGEFEGRLWITMEYVDGTDASELIKDGGPVSPDLAVQLIGGAAAALDYAWKKSRVTHRDVKPANILVALDGDEIEAVKLADFGIAKAAGESTSLTSTGMTVGTMQYISPEAIEGEEVDNRSDLYSLGCTAFHLLTGRPPFTGTTIASTMSAHLTKPVPYISAVNPHLPEAMDPVFARALAKDPADRYQSCAEFVTALHEATGGEVRYPASAQTLAAATLPSNAPTQVRKVAAKASPAPEPKSRTVPIAVAVVATVAVAATAVGVYVTRGGNDEPAAPATHTPVTTTAALVTTPVSVAPPPPPPVVTTTVAPTTRRTTAATTAASPSIYDGMPCDSPGARSPDGRFGCSGENLIWVDLNAAPLPTIGWDSIGKSCTSPGAKARLEASDGVLTCTSTGGGTYTWVAGSH